MNRVSPQLGQQARSPRFHTTTWCSGREFAKGRTLRCTSQSWFSFTKHGPPPTKCLFPPQTCRNVGDTQH